MSREILRFRRQILSAAECVSVGAEVYNSAATVSIPLLSESGGDRRDR